MEKVCTTAGKEFGPEKVGCPVIITRALYGLRAWRDHMASMLRDSGYSSCKANPDIWMRAKTKPDGFKFWSYILVYTDDLFVVDHEPQVIMDYMSSQYTLNPGSVQEPDSYLGAQEQVLHCQHEESRQAALGHVFGNLCETSYC
jgi:hypothetical protein